MVEGKWFQPGADAAEAFAIREAVFGRGRDEMDNESWNVLVWFVGALTPPRAACGGVRAPTGWGISPCCRSFAAAAWAI